MSLSPCHSDLRAAAKEYEAVIRTMKEQIHLLKSKLALAEDSLRRYRCNEEPETKQELVTSK